MTLKDSVLYQIPISKFLFPNYEAIHTFFINRMSKIKKLMRYIFNCCFFNEFKSYSNFLSDDEREASSRMIENNH